MSVADLGIPARQPFPRPTQPAFREGDARLRDLLKRCSSVTYFSACRFRASRDPGYLPVIVRGIIERFLSPRHRGRLRMPYDDLRLAEDLGIDSLTMLEIVSLAEEVFQISIANEDLPALHTIRDVVRFLDARIRTGTAADGRGA